ncbi:MAG: glycoside hydrolase family 2 TIM barrel-domain containing protein [Verrucomicrobiota bacterium]|jgi:hypothetical protein
MNLLRAMVLSLAAATLMEAAETPRQRTNIDFDWRFHLGDVPAASAPEFADGSWRLLDVPHDFSAEGDFSRTNASCTAFLPGGIAWYRKTVVIPADWRNKLVSVEFDGVSMNSEVWINGHFLGKRPYAYSTFSYDLTPHVRPGTNVLAVRVDHSQIVDSRWYTGSGIYRHVWLNATEKLHVARHGLYVTTPEVTPERARVAIQTRVQNETAAGAEVELVTELADPGRKAVQQVTSRETIPAGGERVFTQSAEVTSPKLWSPATPALYRAVTTIRAAGKVVDRLETPFGIRSIRFDAQEGFFLNGQSTKFKGICLHHDAGVVGAAVPDKVLERRLRLAKECGCNAIRTSHNPAAPEFYDLCDRMGLMVMDEAFDEWTGAKNKWIEGRNAGTPSRHGYAEVFNQWAEADLREMALRDRNHPSIVLWSIGNEIDYPNDPFSHPADGNRYRPQNPSAEILAQIAPRLIKVVRECDSSRPVTAALANLPASNATGLADLLDVAGYNYQIEQYEKDFAAFPARKFVGSETGFGMEYVQITRRPRVTGQFLWVGFDYLGEADSWPSRGSAAGLFDTRGFLKPRGALRVALWSEKPVVFAGVRSVRGSAREWGQGGAAVENHWNWQEDSRPELPVDVYANCEAVELFLNGQSLGRKSAADARNCVFSWKVPFKAGELKAVGTRAGQTVENRLVTAGAPTRLELAAEPAQLAADGRDVAHVEVRLVDANGVLVPNADALCTAKVTGAGRLLGLDNGDQRDMSALRSPTRRTRQGRALALVQSARAAGTIELTVSAPGLPEARLSLRAE